MTYDPMTGTWYGNTKDYERSPSLWYGSCLEEPEQCMTCGVDLEGDETGQCTDCIDTES